MKQRGIFHGWFIVGACFLILFFLHGVIINTFGVFVKPVCEGMGWGRGTFSLALGVGALAMAVGAPVVGRSIDLFGARKTMLVGCLLCGAGMMSLYWAASILHFCLLFTLIGFGLSASTIIPVSLVIANWFKQKRGLAMGASFMGTSVGGMFMNPINTKLVEVFGWRMSYVLLGAIVTLASVPLVLLLIRTRPSEIGLLPDGEPPQAETPPPMTGDSLNQAMKTAAFWFIAVNMLLTNFMANSIGAHCIPYLTDIGHSPMIASLAVSFSFLFMTLGKIGLGSWADRHDPRTTFVYSAIMTAAGLVILLFARPLFIVALFVFVYGFPQGGPLTLTPLVASNCHGLRSFGSIFGMLTLFSILGAAIGPVVVGYMYDASDSYNGAFILLIGMTLLSAYCIYMARPREEFVTAALAPAKIETPGA